MSANNVSVNLLILQKDGKIVNFGKIGKSTLC